MTPQRKASVSSAAPRTNTKRKRREESSDAAANQEGPMEVEEVKNEVQNDPEHLPEKHTQRRDADGRRWCDTTLHHCPLALKEWLDYKQVTCDACGNEQKKGSDDKVFASWSCEAHDHDICFKCIPIDMDLPSNATAITIAPTEKSPESPTRLAGLRRVQGEWQHRVDFEGAQCTTRIWTPTTDSRVPCSTCGDACTTTAAGTPQLWRCDGHAYEDQLAYHYVCFSCQQPPPTTPNQDKQVCLEVHSKLANMLQNPKTAKAATTTSPSKAKHRKKGRSPLTKSGGTASSTAPAVGT